MDEVPSVYPDLNNQVFILNRINEIKDSLIAEIKERELMSQGLSKYITAFDKALIALFATSGRISIASFASVIGALLGIGSACFSFAFSLNTGIIKNY